MQRKVQIVRFWLLCFAALVVACLWPHWAILLPPILFFPGQAGCFCCGSVCPFCSSGTPSQYEVAVALLADELCTDCTDLNGTYVVTKKFDCYWEYIIDPEVCTFDRIFVNIQPTGGSVFVESRFEGITNSERFKDSGTVGSSIDCLLSSYNLPPTSGIGTQCDNTGATCVVTAL